MNEPRATASAATKVSEDMSVKDAEILRLIEERRNTPKGEAETKGYEQMHKQMHQRQKRMKRQMDIQRIPEDFNHKDKK